MFDVNDLHGEEVFVEEVADKEVNDEVQKVFEEVVEYINTAKLIVNAAQVSAAGEVIAASIETTVSVEKGKAIMIEEPMKPKKKDQIRLDEKATLKLQAEFNEEEQRLTREQWDDIQAKIDADYQLAQRLQAKEQQELNDAEKATLFMQFLKKKIKAFNRVNTFVDFRTEFVEELKELMEIIPDKEEVAIDAIPFPVKSPKIVDWKIHKEGKKSYYQIIRANKNSKMYMVFNRMFKEFDREDLEDLYNLTMFEPHIEDQVWKKQHGYRVLEWKLYESCRLHSLISTAGTRVKTASESYYCQYKEVTTAQVEVSVAQKLKKVY
nr:hypothetical protein [Tanacetum cinerariifolium]